MANGTRVYFLGAGASKQDRFPLTSELKHGIAWAILEDPSRFASLAGHLRFLYAVDDLSLQASARAWRALKDRTELPASDRRPLPDVTDVLSTLDWMVRDQSSFGPGQQLSAPTGPAPTDELAAVRDLVVQALCVCLGTYVDDLNSAVTTRALLDRLRPGDALITTNWDLLLDAARDMRFGSSPEDYGTTGHVVVEGGREPASAERPKLLKLHGSLSWRYCPRCQHLVIDPWHHVAGDRHEGVRCLCTSRYSELIVTPGFVREYRNVHLLNIWREALLALAGGARWIFIGYSLPADDVAIRTLLLKARCLRQDVGEAAPNVKVVTGPDGRVETLRRYQTILPQADLYQGDFGRFVEQWPR